MSLIVTMSILFLTLLDSGLITSDGVIFFSMMARSEHEPGPRSAFFGGVRQMKRWAPRNAQLQSQNMRRAVVAARSVGWSGFATG